jgi:hypothetical protein
LSRVGNGRIARAEIGGQRTDINWRKSASVVLPLES